MELEISTLQRLRGQYRPCLPGILSRGISGVRFAESSATSSVGGPDAIRQHFPRSFGRALLTLEAGEGPSHRGKLKVGVVLSGGQAPGGHNVITGLFDALRGFHPDSELFGFRGGPKGVFTASYRELTESIVNPYRNTGGFDMIGSGRDKIETPEQLQACLDVCGKLALNGLVIIGGDDSNTNAAILAEYFLEQGCPTVVAGVPKTIDGDLKGAEVEASFGFDTATKVFSESIGSIARDAKSAGKYWHFIKLMGRSASHVTLECAFQTQVNVALIAEEVEQKGLTLTALVDRLADLVRRRSEAGKAHGVCLVPEGLIEFIPEMRRLIDELNELLSQAEGTEETVAERLSKGSAALFRSLPSQIARQLLLDRDSHGNVQVSKIDTEALLTQLIADRLSHWAVEGKFHGKFSVQNHFFGYEGRCAAPSNFDADYTYALGTVAAALVAFEKTGYLCGVQNLVAPAAEQTASGIPLTSLMQIETRKGKPTPVIAKALVRLDGAPFRRFAAERKRWEEGDAYLYPGAIQYFGPDEITSRPTRTLELERGES